MKSIEEDLTGLATVFSDDGNHFDAGCVNSQIEHHIKISKSLVPNKPVCVISKWTWWDIVNTDQSDSEDGYAVIKSDFVIEDEAGRFRQSDWVRTSPLVHFHPPCLFETRNTVYLLVGPGTRKTAPADQAMRFF